MTKLCWEAIEEVQTNSSVMTVLSARLRVQGGWIIRTIVSRYDAGVHTSQTFVPDPIPSKPQAIE